MMDSITATVYDENGTPSEQTFLIERQFTVANKGYLALIPVDDDDLIYLFAYTQTDGVVTLVEIEDDDEYDRVAKAYEAMLDTE